MLVSVVIHKDKESDYGVTVPDFPGCFSAGDSVEDALLQAVEAIELHLEGMLEDGEAVPELTPFEVLQKNKDHKSGVWFFVSIDPSKIAGKAKRINITIPERLLDQIDKAVELEQTSRSGFLTAAAMERVSRMEAA